MDWEKRKKSEQWVAVMAEKYVEDKSELTFAEWCYRQGQAEERRKFAEWLAHNRKYNPMKYDIGFAWSDEAHFSTVEEVLSEYEKEQKNVRESD